MSTVITRMPTEEDSRDAGSPQLLCVRWNNYQNNLTTSFDQLYQTQSFVDVTLACDDGNLKAHKIILSACSPYFEKILMENPCPHPVIILRDIKFKDLKAAVDFMYKGEINVAEDHIQRLLKVASTLRIRGLTDVSGDITALPDEPGDQVNMQGEPVNIPAEPIHVPAPVRAAKRPSSTEYHTGPRSCRRISTDHRSPGTDTSDGPANEETDIRPGIAEMIREEERARMLENSHPWMGPSTSSGLTGQLGSLEIPESYQYRVQNLWQQCWKTNQNMVNNLRLRERGPLKSWQPQTMAEAIFAVLKDGLSLSQAARKYDIPYPTFVLYANRVHNMLGPSADGGADLRPKGRGRPQRILLGVWPDDHIRGVIRTVVFRENPPTHTPHHALREVDLPVYPMLTESVGAGGVPIGGNGCATGGGRDGHISPSAAAAAAVAAVAQGLRMCNMVAGQRATEHGAHVALPQQIALPSPRLPSPLTAGMESPLCSPPPPPGHEPARPADPFRPFENPPLSEMGPPKTPISRNNQGASPLEGENPPVTDGARVDI